MLKITCSIHITGTCAIKKNRELLKMISRGGYEETLVILIAWKRPEMKKLTKRQVRYDQILRYGILRKWINVWL